jgi:hypothetical protein
VRYAAGDKRPSVGQAGAGHEAPWGGSMKVKVAYQVKPGGRISYDDGRPGHQDVRARVREVTDGHGMLVQFDDRADTNYVLFSDSKWMDCISVIE